jgi:hypothetical protein
MAGCKGFPFGRFIRRERVVLRRVDIYGRTLVPRRVAEYNNGVLSRKNFALEHVWNGFED